MKSTTVRELRNHYSKVLKWVAKGEEVQITRRGKVVAKVVPATPSGPTEVDWSKSAAFNQAPWPQVLSAEQSAAILAESQGT
jgi:prevent-host-death family protein